MIQILSDSFTTARETGQGQVCSHCVMDQSDLEITFDDQGVCSHCQHYDRLMKERSESALQNLSEIFARIRKSRGKQNYDCIMGMSGGVDSSYVAHLASEHGLKPLVVHLDNGWNSELAVANIHAICKSLRFDLHTHVIDWGEFRDLQKAFFKANVIDIEMVTDHAIFAIILNLARKHGIHYMLSGANLATESVMPRTWAHRKSDWRNIKDIHSQFGEVKLKTFPKASTWDFAVQKFIFQYKTLKPLNHIAYKKREAMSLLQERYGWRPYPGKHYESIFTKFYQAYILPKKFKVDKRKPHLSSLILSGQLKRDEALVELQKPLYDEIELKREREFVLKKLGFSKEWFEYYMSIPGKSHYDYESDEKLYQNLKKIRDWIGFRE